MAAAHSIAYRLTAYQLVVKSGAVRVAENVAPAVRCQPLRPSAAECAALLLQSLRLLLEPLALPLEVLRVCRAWKFCRLAAPTHILGPLRSPVANAAIPVRGPGLLGICPPA